MKKIVFAFILLLLLMAAVVVMWGQINKVLKDLSGARPAGPAATSTSREA